MFIVHVAVITSARLENAIKPNPMYIGRNARRHVANDVVSLYARVDRAARTPPRQRSVGHPLTASAAACFAGFSGNPARSRTEHIMAQSNHCVETSSLLVRDAPREYRAATGDQAPTAAREVLSRRVRQGSALASPAGVRIYK
jgi:hypothetical protein